MLQRDLEAADVTEKGKAGQLLRSEPRDRRCVIRRLDEGLGLLGRVDAVRSGTLPFSMAVGRVANAMGARTAQA